jgi:hypothetical protein
MFTNRRRFLEFMVPASLTLVARPAWTQHTVPMQQAPRPISPRSPNDIDPDAPPINMKKILKAKQQRIEDDVQKLYTLASELREQVKNTDSTTVLSLALVQKAEEIEKLAHQIRSLAKG